MKATDILVVGLTALATMLAVGTLLGPAPGAHADQDDYRVVASGTPTLALGGAELSLKTDKQVYRPGDRPVVTLKAQNNSNRPVKLTVKASMFSMAPTSELSRMVSMPTELWKEDCLVDLKPNETRSFTLKTGAGMRKGESGYFLLEAGKQRAVVARFDAPRIQGAENVGLANQVRSDVGTAAGRAAGDRS